MDNEERSEGESVGLTSGQVPKSQKPWVALLKVLGLLLIGFVIGFFLAPALNSMAGSKKSIVEASLRFLVVGDWGREGAFNQSHVADAMGVVAEKMRINFVISTGDNFYERGLNSIQDPLFDRSFSSIYKARSLQTIWYAVLGNHDYYQVAAVQTDPLLKLRDPRWHCQRSFSVVRDICPIPAGSCNATAELFFIDTSPFVTAYWGTLNFSALNTQAEEVAMSLKTLNASLSTSSATWKLVIGHHPIRSMGDHGDTLELIESLLPLLEEKHVDLYINGHDHALELIKRADSPIPLLTSGAGSKCYWPQTNPIPEKGLLFDHNGQGFVSVEVSPTRLRLDFHDLRGSVLYSHPLSKSIK